MPEYNELERQVLDHFKRLYLTRSQPSAEDRIYKLVVEHKYGEGARDPLLVVDWKKVFMENKCPSCDDLLSLGKQSYACKKCGFLIPLSLYDEAVQEAKEKVKFANEGGMLVEKLRLAGIRRERVGELRDVGYVEALDEMDERERMRRRQEEEKATEPRRGVTIKNRGVGNAKR